MVLITTGGFSFKSLIYGKDRFRFIYANAFFKLVLSLVKVFKMFLTFFF